MRLSVLHLVLLLDEACALLVSKLRVRSATVRVATFAEASFRLERVVHEVLLDLIGVLVCVDSLKVVLFRR